LREPTATVACHVDDRWWILLLGCGVSHRVRTRNVRVDLDIAPDLPYLAVNEDELKQMLLNLVNNSSDALEGMPGGKHMSIRA
jgi:C4-dicarboxylate-specific signal transduction histidine kinase